MLTLMMDGAWKRDTSQGWRNENKTVKINTVSMLVPDCRDLTKYTQRSQCSVLPSLALCTQVHTLLPLSSSGLSQGVPLMGRSSPSLPPSRLLCGGPYYNTRLMISVGIWGSSLRSTLISQSFAGVKAVPSPHAVEACCSDINISGSQRQI